MSNKFGYELPEPEKAKMILFAGQEALASHFMRKFKKGLEGGGREVAELSDPSSSLQLQEALGTGLFSSSKLLVLKGLQDVKFDFSRIFREFLKSDSDVVCLATADSKFLRTRAAKDLEAAGCEIVRYPQPDNYLSRREMIKKLFESEGGKIEPKAAALLERSVEDCSLIVGFCLQLLSDARGPVTQQDVFAVTGLSPKITAFDAARKALAGDRGALADLREVLSSGEPPIAVIGALDYKLREQCLKGEGALPPAAWAQSFSLLSRANLALTSSSPQEGIDLIYEALMGVCEGAKCRKR
ncbi:MAG: hypothetical protein IKS61_01125 [Aeriscardovia sp.]|nr:hypothetical protein [Aeriscardovia sp.]